MKNKLRFQQKRGRKKDTPPHLDVIHITVKAMPKCYLCDKRFLLEFVRIAVIIKSKDVGCVCPDCFNDSELLKKNKLAQAQGAKDSHVPNVYR